MKFSLKSRHFDKDYAPRVKLLDSLTHKFIPLMGTTLFDDAANYQRVREYRAIAAEFPEIFAYSIENACITNEFIIHDRSSIYLDSSLIFFESAGQLAKQIADNFSEIISERKIEIDNTYADDDVIVMHNEGGGTWGHHIVHNLPRILLYLKQNPQCKVAVPSSHGYAQSNFGTILKTYGFNDANIILVENMKTYQFKRVVIVDFLYNFVQGVAHPEAIKLLGDIPKIDNKIQLDSKCVFVDRLQNKSRNIGNKEDVIRCLKKHDVSIIDLGKESIDSQIEVWQSASTIISTLGSDLTNIVFATSGSRILSLSPDWFGDNFFYHLSIAKQVQWNELRCGAIAIERDPLRMSDFLVDIDMLEGMLGTFV